MDYNQNISDLLPDMADVYERTEKAKRKQKEEFIVKREQLLQFISSRIMVASTCGNYKIKMPLLGYGLTSSEKDILVNIVESYNYSCKIEREIFYKDGCQGENFYLIVEWGR